MQNVLESGQTAYVGSAKDTNRWDYFDQSLVKNIRVEAVRNIDQMPTLAGLNQASAKELLAIQAKILQGLQSHPFLKGVLMNYKQISALNADQKAELTAKGIIINKDKHYSTVVPLLTDE